MVRADRWPTVACVLRSGGEYTREHVIALHRQVSRWWPGAMALRFVALTDTPIGHDGIEERDISKSREGQLEGWWAKMALFQPKQHDLGAVLYFDLDTMVVNTLADIVDVGGRVMLSDFGNPWAAQSGLMHLPKEMRKEVWQHWDEDPSPARARGDGEFLDKLYRHSVARWQTVVPDQIVSYKYHIRQTPGLLVEDDVSVICFHGKPRPWHTPLWARYSLAETHA